MPPPTTPFTIAICGGGIGGLALAIPLLHHKIPVHIYEAAASFGEIGAGVAFGHNAQLAMSLLDPSIRAAYDGIATTNASPEMKDTYFRFVWGMDGRGERASCKAGDEIYDLKDGEVGRFSSVHRAHFLEEMVKQVPDTAVSFKKRVVHVTQTDGKVVMEFQDGSKEEASAVIGCDGVKSHVRGAVVGEDSPERHAKFTGVYAYRGLLPMDKAAALLGDKLARNASMHLGYGGHVLTFPIDHGETMNVVAFHTRDGPWTDERWVVPMEREAMEKDFEGWGSNVQTILSLMEKPDLWALFDAPPAKSYYNGRVCLLGDAAHASTPHQGSGAGMALEDAVVLSRLLREVKKPEELESAFQAYDAVRRERTQRLVRASRETKILYEFEMEGVKDDVEGLRKNLSTRWDWIWRVDLEAEWKEARGLFERFTQ